MECLLAAGGGFILGVILTCILLAKKNLATAQKLTDGVADTTKNNFAAAKEMYKTMVALEEARLNGETIEAEPCAEDEGEVADE